MIQSIIVIKDTITAVINGVVYTLPGASDLTISSLSIDMDEKKLLSILNPKEREIKEYNKMVDDVLKVLSGHKDFVYVDGKFRLNKIPYDIPEMLLKEYVKHIKAKESIEHLNNFWVKCCNNPDPTARENLFWFLKKYGFKITQNGYFIAFRNVNVLTQGLKELHDFVVDQYTLLVNKAYKLAGKRKDYYVRSTKDGYELTTNPEAVGVIASLDHMYLNLNQYTETVYTDSYSKSTRIIMGEPVSIPREKCDPDHNNTCSRGLHVGGASWLSPGYFGRDGIMCLINPANVVAVPPQDNYGKMRVCEYLPYGFYKRDENGEIIMPDTHLMEEAYDNYVVNNIDEVEFNSPHKVKTIEYKSMTNRDFKSLESYTKALKGKLNYIYGED